MASTVTDRRRTKKADDPATVLRGLLGEIELVQAKIDEVLDGMVDVDRQGVRASRQAFCAICGLRGIAPAFARAHGSRTRPRSFWEAMNDALVRTKASPPVGRGG